MKQSKTTAILAGLLVLVLGVGIAYAQLRDTHFVMRDAGALTMVKSVEFFQDSDLGTTDWTYTVTNSTAPTTVTHAHGGTAAFTNAGADNDRIEVDETAEWVKLTDGIRARFQFRGTFSDATQADYGFGIGIIDTDWLGDSAIMSDGIFFEKNDGDTQVDIVIAYNASSTSDYVRVSNVFTADTSVHTYTLDILMDPTVDGAGRVIAYVDGAVVSDVIYASGLPYDEELCIKYGVQNGEGSAKTLTADYVAVGVNRTS